MADAKTNDDSAELKAAAPAAEGDLGTDEGKSKKKLLLIVLAPLLLLVGGVAVAYFTGALDKFLHKEPDCAVVQEGDKDYDFCLQKLAEASSAGMPGSFFDIPDLIVNLNSTGKQPRFLKIGMKLELEDPTQTKKVEEMMPRIVDQFQTYLRELRVEDLRGSSGIYRLRIELLSRVKAAAPGVKVRDVLFQEILIQ